MTDKYQKITKLILAAGGAAVGIFLIAKYHKSIIRKWTKTRDVILYDYAKVQRTEFNVEVINDNNKCQDVLAILKTHCDDFPILGFDCEWVSVDSERRKVALVQLCSSQGLCALIRLCKFTKIPTELKTLLEDPSIIKVGITPDNDANYLLQDYGIHVCGTLDLRFLALLTKHKAEGLGKLSLAILGIELNKSWRIRCSDWEAEIMNQQQIDYAAKDSFVAVEIFRKLYKSISPKAIDIDSIRKFCNNYTNIPFNNKLSRINFNVQNENGAGKLLTKQNAISKNYKRSYTSRSTPLYHNCMLEAPNGDLLCTIDRQKAEWYVKKDLGVEIEKEPVYKVRLNFEPAGRSVGQADQYYQTTKENRCVVCGRLEDLIRKNVVPHEYRKFFPNIMKDKTSHDVLLLCIECHKLSNMYDLSMRRLLEKKCDAPLKSDVSLEDSQVIRKLLSEQRMVRALIYEKKIPEKRREELKEMLKQAYPNQEINENFAEELLSTKLPKSCQNVPPHGELVVSRYKEKEGLVNLEKLWRQHFLDVMKPRFMPTLWDINHSANRLEKRANEGRVKASDLEIAGVDAIVMPRQVPQEFLKSNKEIDEEPIKPNVKESKDDSEETNDSSSDWESFHTARNSNTKYDPERTLTEDDNFFSDATSARSLYETVKSDEDSTLDDFQSFTSSLTERQFYDSDESRSSLSSQNVSDDSDTEIEDDHIHKLEM